MKQSEISSKRRRKTMVMGCDVNHQTVKGNGIWMHVAEKGSGPLVLLLHGFPETWFSWHRQIDFLAVTPDLRGFGDSDAPLSPSSYTCYHPKSQLQTRTRVMVGSCFPSGQFHFSLKKNSDVVKQLKQIVPNG
ncbi:hypothetical protein SASPL_135625 [Salvia splendens]|uniref:AB hydrolase-1 domain-containing protein n=1 Tax=Salvia splendens TaxID=180675 RepID=A0A8X8WYI3_SALSN|nr:hypothetical protein SASPL_135625 [Salvia splendens]